MKKIFENCKPIIENDVYIAENATLVGNVKIGSNSSIWYNAVLRADLSSITIGKCSNVQDNATIHVDVNNPCFIGDNVTIGHNAVIHGATIENNCLIGMGAIVLNGAKILEGSIIAAGSVVPENMIIGPKQLAVGMPAKFVTDINEIHINKSIANAKTYVELAIKHFSNINNDN